MQTLHQRTRYGRRSACHYGQISLDDEAFKPYLQVLDEIILPVIIYHTSLPVYDHSIYHYTILRREPGRIIDQATALRYELFSGMFEEFPNLRFIHNVIC